MKDINWSFDKGNKKTLLRIILSYISLNLRAKQYADFEKYVKLNNKIRILDVGVTPNEDLVDSNFFEKKYPFPENLTVASVEDCSLLQVNYPKIKFKKLKPFSRFPYQDKQFDVVTSWATLEHVGTRAQQKLFISECSRIGKRVFITTPNRWFFFELHSNLFFLHWLPRKYFQYICNILGKGFWGNIKNLNLLSKKDVEEMIIDYPKLKVTKFRYLAIFNTHLIIYKKNN